MTGPASLRKRLRALFARQNLAVLSTHNPDGPYGSLVAFAATDDLAHLLFATTRSTRKYANMAADGRVAMVMDNRSNAAADFRAAMAVTATGTAEEAPPAERDALRQRFLKKHPHLREFVDSPNCALMRVRVKTYYAVTHFQNVLELHMEPCD